MLQINNVRIHFNFTESTPNTVQGYLCHRLSMLSQLIYATIYLQLFAHFLICKSLLMYIQARDDAISICLVYLYDNTVECAYKWFCWSYLKFDHETEALIKAADQDQALHINAYSPTMFHCSLFVSLVPFF